MQGPLQEHQSRGEQKEVNREQQKQKEWWQQKNIKIQQNRGSEGRKKGNKYNTSQHGDHHPNQDGGTLTLIPYPYKAKEKHKSTLLPYTIHNHHTWNYSGSPTWHSPFYSSIHGPEISQLTQSLISPKRVAHNRENQNSEGRHKQQGRQREGEHRRNSDTY